MLAARFPPQSLEDHRRPDRPGMHRDRLAASMGGQQHDRLAELGPGAEQAFELAGLLELVEASQGGDDALSGATALPTVFDDLQVDAVTGLLLA